MKYEYGVSNVVPNTRFLHSAMSYYYYNTTIDLVFSDKIPENPFCPTIASKHGTLS